MLEGYFRIYFDGGKLDVYYEYKRDGLQRRANQFDAKAKEFRDLGGIADKATRGKMANNISGMREILEGMAARGEDLGKFADLATALGVALTDDAA